MKRKLKKLKRRIKQLEKAVYIKLDVSGVSDEVYKQVVKVGMEHLLNVTRSK